MGASGPNSNQTCIEVHLPEETYWPTLDAPWNASHVNTTRVWAELTLGPDQSYQWWHNHSSGSVDAIQYEVVNGTVLIPIDLSLGLNEFSFHLEALERTFVYELNVFLDLEAPELIVESPARIMQLSSQWSTLMAVVKSVYLFMSM